MVESTFSNTWYLSEALRKKGGRAASTGCWTSWDTSTPVGRDMARTGEREDTRTHEHKSTRTRAETSGATIAWYTSRARPHPGTDTRLLLHRARGRAGDGAGGGRLVRLSLAALITVYVVSADYIKCRRSRPPPMRMLCARPRDIHWTADSTSLLYKGDFFEKRSLCGPSLPEYKKYTNNDNICYYNSLLHIVTDSDDSIITHTHTHTNSTTHTISTTLPLSTHRDI